MRQIVMTGPGKSTVVDVPIPEINDDQMLVKVTYTGMCHSEWYPWSVAKAGETFGHESVGTVARIGKNVTGFEVGDRVTGLGGGGYKEYIVMEPDKVCHVPENLKDEDAISEPESKQIRIVSGMMAEMTDEEKDQIVEIVYLLSKKRRKENEQ